MWDQTLRRLAVLLVVLPAAEAVSAQSESSLAARPGARIRVSTRQFAQGRHEAPARLTGTAVAMTDDSLTFRVEGRQPVSGIASGSLVTLGFDAVSRLEMSQGSRRAAPEGAALGALVGLGVGIVMASRVRDCGQWDLLCSEDLNRAASVAAGLWGGASIGALIGAFIKVDRWTLVPIDRARVQLRAAVGRRGELVASVHIER